MKAAEKTADWRAKFAALNPRPIDLGLVRMRQGVAALGHPERGLPRLIHVAGTNGKGGVIAALETALVAAGLRVQSYTSPFLWNFEENLRLDGHPIDPDLCAAHFAALWDRCGHLPLTWFEADTLVALKAFNRWQADVTLIECGMGGASDATAIVPPPLAAVLTNIGGDHGEFLGHDLAQVALEKAGIAKGAPLYLPADFAQQVGVRVTRVTTAGQLPSLALANAVLERHFPGVPLLKQMPPQLGRWMRDLDDPHRIYDVGHNAHAAAFLATRLAQEPGPYILEVGMLRRKDLRGFLAAFAPLRPRIRAVDLGAQGYSVQEVKATAQSLGLGLALSTDGEARTGTRLITGSHQSVAKVLGATGSSAV